MARPLNVHQDHVRDTITICGVRYSADLFRRLALADPGSWFRIEGRSEDGISVFQPNDEIERTFDLISGRHVKQRAGR